MRFMGGKQRIIPIIKEIIKTKTINVETISDLFSGSGVVSTELKKEGYNIISNDLMYFSYVLLRGKSFLIEEPRFLKLKNKGIFPIEYLNNIFEKNKNQENEYFIRDNYSPKGNRQYFSEKNALKIDLIRQNIEKWKKEFLINEDEYFYLLAMLLEAVPYISNITGVYGAYLKFWDKRSLNELMLKKDNFSLSKSFHQVFNQDANVLVKNIEVDLAYYDPPYNQRQYLPNYHILETIAKYDNPKIKGITGIREYEEQKSKYCQKSLVYQSLLELVCNTKAKYILLSYSTEGILTQEEIKEILLSWGKKETFEIIDLDYYRYKNAKTKENKNLKELLFFIAK